MFGLTGFWLGETNRMNQIYQINKTNQINQTDGARPSIQAIDGLLCEMALPQAIRPRIGFQFSSRRPHSRHSTAPNPLFPSNTYIRLTLLMV